MIKAEKQFYIFGMGNREKFIYKAGGELISFPTNETIYKFDVKREKFLFDRYMVVIWTNDEKIYLISEDSWGAYIYDIKDAQPPYEGRKLVKILTTSEYINLPDFEDTEYPEQLRILHGEILVSFNGILPVPNIYTYKKPWYRDGAMMAMVLEKTKNLHLIRPWALSVREPYDKNNKGNCEPDNLGQLAFVLSYFVDKNYPLIAEIYNEAERIAKNGLLTGLTDYGHHEIYSTLWLKLAFDRLGIRADYIDIPMEYDRYARMFWMDKRGVEVDNPFDNEYDVKYPYLTWATYHFNGDEIPKELLKIQYPMSWEIEASEANYELIAPLSEKYSKNKCSAPHSWHAAEMFLYLIEVKI
jgi:hypothetical protein